MKKVLSLFLAVVMVMSVYSIVPFEVGAIQTDKVETSVSYTSGDYKYTLIYGGAKIIYYAGSATTMDIPSTLDGYKVISIGDSAFSECSSLTSITIPDGVTSIGDWAFSYCKSLTSITIPDSVTNIGNYAFCHCERLTSITIPRGVTRISYGLFNYCERLTSITIPEGVTLIGDYAFEGCYNLSSITIPDSVKIIGNQAFSACHSLTSITIPSSVTSIRDKVFIYCHYLTSIKIYSENCSFGKYCITEYSKIYCFEGSTAEEYAKTHRIAYEYFCQNGHTEVTDKGYPATKEKDGLTDGSHCSVCNKVLVKQEVIPRLGLLGDLDDDGEVSIMDATAIQLHIAQLVPIPDEKLEYGDTDKDGEVSIMDATQIQLFIAQLIPSL